MYWESNHVKVISFDTFHKRRGVPLYSVPAILSVHLLVDKNASTPFGSISAKFTIVVSEKCLSSAASILFVFVL